MVLSPLSPLLLNSIDLGMGGLSKNDVGDILLRSSISTLSSMLEQQLLSDEQSDLEDHSLLKRASGLVFGIRAELLLLGKGRLPPVLRRRD